MLRIAICSAAVFALAGGAFGQQTSGAGSPAAKKPVTGVSRPAAKTPAATSKPTATSASKPAGASAAKGSTASSTTKRSASSSTARRRTTQRTATASWRTRQMQPTSERYKAIQDALVAKGFLQQEQATGVWDASSTEALKQFQTQQNLDASGKINSLSLIALGLGPRRDTASTKALDQSLSEQAQFNR